MHRDQASHPFHRKPYGLQGQWLRRLGFSPAQRAVRRVYPPFDPSVLKSYIDTDYCIDTPLGQVIVTDASPLDEPVSTWIIGGIVVEGAQNGATAEDVIKAVFTLKQDGEVVSYTQVDPGDNCQQDGNVLVVSEQQIAYMRAVAEEMRREQRQEYPQMSAHNQTRAA